MNENENERDEARELDRENADAGEGFEDVQRDPGYAIGEPVRVWRWVAAHPQSAELVKAGPFAGLVTGIERDADGDPTGVHCVIFPVGSAQHVTVRSENKLGSFVF